jgi:hypothetical protein
MLVIDAVALLSGSPLAHGRLAGSLDPGCSSWQLALVAASPADAGVGDGTLPIDDGAIVEDAAIADASVVDAAPMVDLSLPRDLLPPRDLSVLPTVVFGSVTNTPEYSASSTATQFDDACPAHQALIGYDGYRDDGNGLVGQVIPLCGTVTVSAGGSGLIVHTTAGATLPARGGTTNTACPRHCAQDQVVVGFTGRTGTLVDQLIITCAPLTIDGNSNFVVGATTNLPACGGNGGSATPQTNCPSGLVATVSRTRISGFVEAFGLGCSKPTLQ